MERNKRIFIVSRTSTFFEDKKPCKEAIKKQFAYWHIRTCNEKEFNLRFSEREGKWRDNGTEHSVLPNGYIQRKEDLEELWTIEINTMGELLGFIEKYGKIVMSYNESYKNYEVEIYDDYRE